jgi:ATP-dependent exoDNAse (exonuclease V) beta subunit
MYVAMTRARDLLYVTTHAPKNEETKDFFGMLEGFASKQDCALSVLEAEDLEEPTSNAQPGPPDVVVAEAPLGAVIDAATAAARRVGSVMAQKRAVTPLLELSFSKLSTFRQCSKKYAFRYLYGLSFLAASEHEVDENVHDVSSIAIGNLLHQTLMHYHRELKIGGAADALRILEDFGRRTGRPKEDIVRATEMLKKYLESDLSRMATLHEEKEFRWRILEADVGLIVKGTIDRIHRQGDVLKIVDYKSGARDDESHRFQLALYKMAFQAIVKESGIRTSVFLLSRGEEVEYSFSEDELAEILKEVTRSAREILRQDFTGETRREDDCKFCEFLSFCRR